MVIIGDSLPLHKYNAKDAAERKSKSHVEIKLCRINRNGYRMHTTRI
jgi:hypothetical protein